MNGGVIRLALVGVGEIARHQHLPALASDTRFAVVATVDPDLAAARSSPLLAGVPHFGTLRELLTHGPPTDAVALCTPPRIRTNLAETAIDAGLAILLEKPPAATVSAASLLAVHAQKAGVSLFTAWHSQQAAGVEKARQHLALHHIHGAKIVWREDVRHWHPGQEWLLGAGGFGAFDSGINALSILASILPLPLVVESCHLRVPANRQAPVTASLWLRHGNAPVAAEFDILHTGAPEWTISVDTDGGDLVLTQGGNSLTIDGVPVPCEAQREYPRLYDRFATLIAACESDVDLAPLMLVADACLVASRETVAPFEF